MSYSIRTIAALAHVMACKQLSGLGLSGQFQFTRGDDDAVSLWMIPLSKLETYQPYQGNIKVSAKEEVFEFALQDGFEGEVFAGDSISDNDVVWRVETIDRDQSGAIFKCKCTVKTARQVGV